jgi:hypothetical protein
MSIDMTLRCSTCGRRADMCFEHGDNWKKRGAADVTRPEPPVSSAACKCAGPMANTHVDGNGGHSPGCPLNPLSGPHPEYLDDDGNEGVQFVRHDLASTEDGVIAYLTREGLYDDRWPWQFDVVWMRPNGEGVRGDDWYSIVPEARGVVRYWRLRP